MARDDAYRNAEKRIKKARLDHATELDLANLGLTALPESLGQFTQLQSLDLEYNRLTALPESLDQLTQLQSLHLGHNQLPKLPEWLGQLTKLQRLFLHNNQLTELPESLGQLTQLHLLNLRINHLLELPESLGRLTQLQSLNLAANQLTKLPEWLAQLTQLQELTLHNNELTELPESLGQLTQLRELQLSSNELTVLPESLGQLTQLQVLVLHANQLTSLPEWLGQLTRLQVLDIDDTQLTALPEWLGQLAQLQALDIQNNQLTSLPESLGQLTQLRELNLDNNPLNAELAAAYAEGTDAVMRYLRAKAEADVVLNEAKLILIGEGEVGKSCLLGALRGDPWEEGRPTTHGIEIKPVDVVDPRGGTQITLNGWDFGGQRVYRPTHQLFFSAPAVYLVVWKPREGSQAGAVKEWIKLVKHREPDAKILVVATHGGPKERQPDIDRQEIWDLFGKDTVVDFFLVESKPDDETQERKGIAELKQTIARVAAELTDYTVPARWKEAREALKGTGAPYLSWDKVVAIVDEHKVDRETVSLFVRWCHRLGHLIHYEHDQTLGDIVILKPDWLAKAVSFVLDDKETREGHGLVSFARLGQLWHDPQRAKEDRYPSELHAAFLRLMERFDLSYRVAEPQTAELDGTSLIAQLVSDVRPTDDLARVWPGEPEAGDEQQVQICQIVDEKRQSTTAEGLFYQLTVRLHKFSLGRMDYHQSVHWQRGLVLDDDYNGRALLEHVGNDVRITVRAAYPERLLSVLTHEVKWLVESFWEGLHCDVMVPCIKPCGRGVPGTALFDVEKLITSKKGKRPEYPCPVCADWQNIDALLRNAPAARRLPAEELLAELTTTMKAELAGVRQQLIAQRDEAMGRFDHLDINTQRILSEVDDAFNGLMQTLTDEAKDGPRLFSFEPVDPGFFDRPKWISEKFRLTLWCEHSRLPLPALNDEGDRRGVYELNLPRDWFVKAAPLFKVLTGMLSLVAPVASSVTKLVLDDAVYKGIEDQLDLGQKSLDSVLQGGQKAGAWLGHGDAPDLERGEETRAQGAVLRQLHVWLKEKDPSFGGLVRVQNKRQEFLWVHPRFENEY